MSMSAGTVFSLDRSRDTKPAGDSMTFSSLYTSFQSGGSVKESSFVQEDNPYESVELNAEQSSRTYEAVADKKRSDWSESTYASIDEAKTSF